MKFNFCLLSILMMGINALSINRKDFLKYPGSFIVSKSVDSNKLKQDTSPIIDNAYLSNENSNPEVLENNNNDIYFYGPVNMRSCIILKNYLIDLDNKSNIFKAQYKISPPPINLHIQSPGGSLLHAFYIIDLIRTLETPVHTYIDGFAASAATLMSVVGKKRFITKNSLMLIHQLSGSEGGKYSELKDEMANFDTMMNNIDNIYLEYSKLNKTKLHELLSHDLWLNSELALEYGLVDEII